MKALHRKLIRDLMQMKGQGLAISLVIASGVAMFIMYMSTFQSLMLTRETYYQRYRFADVFARVKRAPAHLADRIREIPGVSRVDTRVVVDVVLDVEGMSEPAVGRLISIPEKDLPTLNDVVVRKGRYIEPDRSDEALVSEGFALAHGLEPGDRVSAVINGRLRKLRIVGIALSPEYVYPIRPGEVLPDNRRFGIFWMERKAIASAFDMEGGFNDVSLALGPNTPITGVIDRLDRILRPYGGLGGHGREQQISHWYLDSELVALQTAGKIVPFIFLGVAAFLLNVVLTRIVSVQREQIAALKALGYSNWEIGSHYTQWSLAIAMTGGLIGVLSGAWLGSGMISLYNDFFRFPFLQYSLAPQVVLAAVGISIFSACFGAFGSVKRAVELPPAEAMRPEPPANFKLSWWDRVGVQRFFSQTARMVIRNLRSKPGRTAASIIGISFAATIYVVGIFTLDAMDQMLDIQFNLAQRQDLTVSFAEPTTGRVKYDLQSLTGVVHTERTRSVSVRFRNGHRSRQTAITGLTRNGGLQRLIDTSIKTVSLPSEGLLLSTKLADILDIHPGQFLTVEVLEGTRPTKNVIVSGVVDDLMGMSVYMDFEALRDLTGEGEALSGAYLLIDEKHADSLYARLKRLPKVAGVALKSAAIDNFEETLGRNLNLFIFFNMMFAAVIAFGVVYNAARISFSERSRELASLRVMGFTRMEISKILLGELAVVTLVAIPIGLLIGYGLAALVVMAYDTELYRLPLVVSGKTFAEATLTVLVAAVVSGLIVRRKLDRLDLVEVLKTRE